MAVGADSRAHWPTADPAAVTALRTADVISALSFALDLTEGQPMGHAVRACLLGMRLAGILGLSPEEQADLYYALLLKDCGCSSNAARLCGILDSDERRAKQEVKLVDWTRPSWETFRYLLRNVAPSRSLPRRLWRITRVAARHDADSAAVVSLRCERGAGIAGKIGFSPGVAAAIHALDEHWNGRGYPDRLRGAEIPLLARIMNLCQTWEVFAWERGPQAAMRALERRAGRWFDPELVRAARTLEDDAALWQAFQAPEARQQVLQLDPGAERLDPRRLDEICEAFAEIVDAKSPYTYRHSLGVAAAADGMSAQLGLPSATRQMIRRAALLHDIGKLAVPNSILDKPGRLSAEEWRLVRRHPYYTQEILGRVGGFTELAPIAAAHHERLDGKGYYLGLDGRQLSLPARLLAVADVFDALHAARPYRGAMPLDQVWETMAAEVPRALDAECFAALRAANGGVTTAGE